jgi:hypothetical protein
MKIHSRKKRLTVAMLILGKKLEGAPAPLVVDSIAELPEAVDIIQQWISEGKTP